MGMKRRLKGTCNILMGMKRRLKGTCKQLSRIFGIFMIKMGMKSGKIILRISSGISLAHTHNCHYTQMKLTGS